MTIDIDELTDQLDSSIPTISEPLFRRDFLPFFINKVSVDQVPTAIAAWIHGVAGSSSTPVNVVDASGTTLLFQVPALMDTTRITVTDADHFEYVASVYTTHKRNQPEQAEKLMNAEMTAAVVNSLDISPNTRWDPMLAYYKLLPEKQATEAIGANLLSDLGI